MKKNLRIVSAAAAALLAVAPVAATAVVSAPTSTVQAANTEDTVASMGKFGTVASNNVSVSGNLTGSSVPFAKETESAFTGSAAAKINPPKLNVQGNAAPVESKYVSKSVKLDGKTPSKTAEVKAGNHIISADYTYTLASATTAATNATIGGVQVEIPANVKTITVTFSKAVVMNAAPASTEAENVYFARWDGRELANDATVVANNDQNNVLFINGEGKMRSSVTLAELKVAIENVLTLRNNKNEKASWSKNVWNNATSDDNLISQLRHAGFTVTGSGDKASFKPGSTQFTINVKALNGATANVVFQNSYAPDTVSPVIMGNYNGSWEPVRTPGGYIRPIIVSQNDLGNNSAWNPYDYLRADANSSTKAWINADYSGDKVDLTKAGVYNVTVKATNAANKTTTETVPVIVSDINGKVMTVVNNAPVYAINNGVATQATGLKTLPVGSQVKVFGSVVTAKLNGQDTQFYRIVTPKANYFVRASDLKDGVVSTPAQETTKTVTIMHISTVYDKNGKATHEPALRAYDTYSVVSTPVNLKDEKGNDAGKFYKLAGKDQYIKVGNVDGTSRSLKHNSYVYKSTGKRANKKTLKKGSSVTTYGKSFMIAGHQMYRIGKNQYVKKANF